MDRTILIIEDEQKINDILAFSLGKDGYKTLSAFDGVKGLEMALKENPDLILLDVMLPGMDGFEVCRKVREKSQVPIIMLTARADEVDKVLGLEMGADDYVTKPFGSRELMARVKANLRRTAAAPVDNGSGNVGVYGDLTIDFDRYEVRKRGELINLTLKEYDLLKFLATQQSQVFTREKLLEKVWGYEYFGEPRGVDVTIRRLREKIEDDASKPRYIMTKRGVGYYFSA